MPQDVHYSLDQLLVLEAIAQTGTFAGAARSLHRVPSAVSYAIKTLEQGLGVELFDRTGHRARLTAAGQRVLAQARDVLQQARSLQAAARQMEGGWEAELQVVVDGALPLDGVISVLRAFGAQRVPTRIRVDIEYQEGVPERFEQDDADIMLNLGYDEHEEVPDLDSRFLPPLELLLVAASDHPLATEGERSPEDLADFSELIVKDSSSKYASAPRASFLGSRNTMYLSDFHAKRLALLGGAGFGWIPSHFVREDLQQDRLRVLEVTSGARWTYHPRLLTRRDRAQGRAANLFLEVYLATTAS